MSTPCPTTQPAHLVAQAFSLTKLYFHATIFLFDGGVLSIQEMTRCRKLVNKAKAVRENRTSSPTKMAPAAKVPSNERPIGTARLSAGSYVKNVVQKRPNTAALHDSLATHMRALISAHTSHTPDGNTRLGFFICNDTFFLPERLGP